MAATSAKSINRPALIIGVLLLAIAAITIYDAANMRIRAQYGIGANAASYGVAVFLIALAIGHFFSAFRTSFTADHSDWKAVGWVALALTGLIGSVWLQGGFILGSTLLFALTARAFGRKAIIKDLIIGAVLGLLVFLLFHNLLTLSLPEGPLERLL